MRISTHLNRKKNIDEFLEKELLNVQILIAINSNESKNHQLMNFSDACFVVSFDDKKQSILIN